MVVESIPAFWQWFEQEVLPALRVDELPGEDVVRELDARMCELGVPWELGPAPDDRGGWAFAVSFGADPERLPIARAIAEGAPRMTGCQVLLGRPAKRWTGAFDLRSAAGDRVRVETADWPCVLVPWPPGVAVVVSPTGADDLDESTAARAADIAVESALGELRYAAEVRDVSVAPVERTAHLVGVRCRMQELGSAMESVLGGGSTPRSG